MVSDPVVVVIITASASLLGSLAALISSLLNRKKLDKLSVEIDGRLTKLLELTASSQRAEGVLEGRVLGVSELQDRVKEKERVEDRREEKDAHKL